MIKCVIEPRNERNCICGEFVDENGYGACSKRDPKVDNLYTCYVNGTSLCSDMIKSTLHPEMQLSAEACEDKNERMLLMKKYIHY